MMQHRELEQGRWAGMSFMEQMSNIGSEVSRTLRWKRKGREDMAWSAFSRCLELLDLTVRYGRQGLKERSCMLRELCRLREMLCEAYLSDDPEALADYDRYFYHFAVGWQVRKHSARI